MYAIKLDENGRVLSVTYPEFATKDMTVVDALPEGDVTDYCYIDGAYIHDPLPVEEPQVEPTTDEVMNALLGVTE